MNALLNLTIELCKGGPHLVMEHIKDLYPQTVCQAIIQDEELCPMFRAQFLDLLMHSYIANDFRYCQQQTYPNFIKFRRIPQSFEAAINEVENTIKERLAEIYLYEED